MSGTHNKLADLNNHLFEELERLNDEGLKGEALQEERERAKSMANIAQTIINNGELALKAVKHFDEYGKADNIPDILQIGDGKDATIFATGICTSEALKAKEELEKEGINVRVVDIFTIKPIDEEIIIKCAKETKKLISVEDHNIIGGLGSAISEVLTDKYPAKLIRMGIKDTFGESGKAEELMKKYNIDKDSIINCVKK